MMIQILRPRSFPDPALLESLRFHVRASGPTAATLQTVTLLLAALEVGQNIDRLARYTGLDRCFVARCARRLIDNGVWRDGQIVCDWRADGLAHPGFWNDVAVAEGKLCRRIDERGMIEWAPPGSWRKNYDFITAEPLEELNVQYQVPSAREANGVETSVAEEGATPIEPRVPVQDSTASPAPRRRKRARKSTAPRQPLPFGLKRPAPAGSPLPVREVVSQRPPPPPKLPDLFPGAVWLG